MITENDLLEAIAECQGVRHPNAQTCIMLSAYYTILDHIKDTQRDAPDGGYSYATMSVEPAEEYVNYDSGTEFSRLINGKSMSEVWPVIDELMTTLQAINPRLYAGVLRKIAE